MNTKMAHVVHESNGRFRLRCTLLKRRKLDPVYLQAVLENIAHVEKVRVNLHAASITVLHTNTHCKHEIIATLEHLPNAAYRQHERLTTTINPVTLSGLGLLTFGLRFLPPAIQGGISLFMALPTLTTGIDTLLNRGIKIDVLDAGVVGFSLMRRDYFTSNMVIFLLKLGEYLEQLSADKTTGLLKALLRPQAEQVWIEKDGVEVQIAIAQLCAGDIIICGPGEMIAIDGTVVRGDASVNQSSITGESLPLHKQTGDDVLSGSAVEEGKIAVRVNTVGNETGIARINRFLENSLRSSSPAQRQSEELADKLVPLTFALGIGIFILTRDIRRAAAALTVDFSCAIKLATPIAVKTAMYTAAQQGVLIKGAHALDQLSHVDTIVFDKTGTLTCGTLEVTDIMPLCAISHVELLALAASAEEHYAHPVAKAVVEAAQQKNIALHPISQVDFIVAHGVSAYVEGQQVLVGSRHFIEDDEQIDCTKADSHADQFYAQGKNLLYVAHNGRLAGLIALRDELRPEAAKLLQQLKSRQIKNIVVLTGDHHKTALALQKQLPQIDQLHWELKPEDKAAIISKLQNEGSTLAFIGDGVNDAPALVSADVGISMPSGADLAKDAAQAILLREDLTTLEAAIDIASRTQKTISTSFYATIGFNSLFLLLALTGRIAPVTAAILHNANTVGILGYSAARGFSTQPNNEIEVKDTHE